MIVCESSQKPLMLFYLVQMHGVRNALVFTKSAESTTRLVRLLEFFQEAQGKDGTNTIEPVVVHAYSSDLPAGERKSVLDKFRAQEIQMCVSFLGGFSSGPTLLFFLIGSFAPISYPAEST